MEKSTLEKNLERLSKSFIPIMHIFHNLACEVSRTADFSLAQYRVLMMVYNQGPMSINDLRTKLKMAQSSASEMVNRLVLNGHLSREKDVLDRRKTVFQLTKTTYNILKKQRESMKVMYKKILEPLNSKEQVELVLAYETILNLMNKIEGLKK